MVRNQEPQAPPQQTPLVAATQPIVDQEALNGQLEDVGANDDNKDRDSDNNNEDNNNNTVNWLDHETEGKKTTRKWKQGLFGSLPQEVQDANIQCAIEDDPEQRKRNNEELEAQRKAKVEKEQLIRELNLHNATEAYIDAMGEPGNVLGESALKKAQPIRIARISLFLPHQTIHPFYMTSIAPPWTGRHFLLIVQRDVKHPLLPSRRL